MSTNKKPKIVWKTPGSDIEHTIPSEAVVTIVDNKDVKRSCWLEDGILYTDGFIMYFDEDDLPDPEPIF